MDMEFPFGVISMFWIKIDVIAVQHSRCTKGNWIVH